jgi:hypothetical protein
MSKQRKIAMYGIKNDTNHWLVAVDGFFALYTTRDRAEEVYYSICPRKGCIDDTAFGCCMLIPPGKGAGNNISNYEPIDLIDFIAKTKHRLVLRCRCIEADKLAEQTTKDRLSGRRFWADMFGGLESN